MRIVVVGSGGRLGGALVRVLGGSHDMVGLDRSALDLADASAVDRMLGDLEFDALLTPAALTNVDYCEEHPDEAGVINGRAPAQMAAIARAKGARMIHFSTDYVFDGRDPRPRTETDPVAPLGAYGRSKAAGEAAVLDCSADFLVARVSWIFGPERPSFLDSIIERALAQDAVQAIADKFSTPSYADDLCVMVADLLGKPRAGGLIHLCNAGSCSWQEYGQAGVDAAVAAGLPVRATTVGPMQLADIGFKAPRPQYTALSVAKFAGLCGWTPRPWREALAYYVSRYAHRFDATRQPDGQ